MKVSWPPPPRPDTQQTITATDVLDLGPTSVILSDLYSDWERKVPLEILDTHHATFRAPNDTIFTECHIMVEVLQNEGDSSYMFRTAPIVVITYGMPLITGWEFCLLVDSEFGSLLPESFPPVSA